ncbi:Bug family tripartite tricarboxylate transporter substrate binding protein [Microlunatus parietis]|uniref:Putative tricarboxylic transport membrane protein n=1 Tax=Microlunatus parietis TaxID=682979 RepID=A0A7Y9LA08_9ACTN|nr:tripartite tricarboxylate transporter substrate binding protein [Microlunatus parietis]NYE72359.1 putative tricarboxylic transport membrane protein [Microlunatus parietis]
MSPPRSRPKLIGLIIYAIVFVTATTTAVVFSVRSASSGTDLRSNLTFIAPAGVGGGWDSFAREQQQAMRSAGIVNNVQVVNIPGAGGTIGLSRFTTMTGQATNVMATGTAMLGGIELNDSPVDLSDVKPIARVAQDYDAVVVSAESPYRSIDDIVAAWRQDPKAVTWTGGSAGSIDHLIIAALALEVGVDPAGMTFIPKSGGGEAMQTLLNGTTDVAVTGYNEIADQVESGRVRALAISAPDRLPGVDLPTLVEAGYQVDLVNWRGVLAPPGITDEELAELKAIIEETRNSTAWQDALTRNKWVDSYLTGAEFDEFITQDQQRIAELIKELGL